MELMELIKILEDNHVGISLSVEDRKIAELKMNGKTLDFNILDLKGLKKLAEGLRG
jgi:hypothetical protein